MMKYIVLENNDQNENTLLGDVSDFLWNNGNEVFIKKSDQCDPKDFDCVVLMIPGYFPSESLFERGREMLIENFDSGTSCNEKPMLIFSKNGVYSNAIPFPHKIYQLNTLNKDSLSAFFNWCRNLNLFITPNLKFKRQVAL